MRYALVVAGACVGFVVSSRHQFNALDPDGVSLGGPYDSEHDAVTAITQRLTNKST